MVLDSGVSAVADLKELCEAAAGVRGIGKEYLVPQALVVVEQGQLGAGVRSGPRRDAREFRAGSGSHDGLAR
ncbi:hypothetical protein GCM10010244_55770 [Streptomyces coeruleorubidus]|nr:hypothetical protein GCM10010244_55770 [Streptomyces bellus]